MDHSINPSSKPITEELLLSEHMPRTCFWGSRHSQLTTLQPGKAHPAATDE
ncbi:hypothetical protein EV14_0467 [Prochlorococcus sp. MIT 0703]|nr:hypothetical protein EV12_1070 [Prochlorococcus sp. MIT 0701]KGG36060.1 hypothetical protein EV14_0467 [Prochlorococcus sp. MIT 0703]